MNLQFTINHTVPATFGVGASKLVGEKLRELGAKTVFLVYDKGIEAAGIPDEIAACIEASGLKAVCYHDVELEPSCSSVDRAAAAAKAAGIDGIVGLGGGSSMDTAKGVSILLSNGGKMKDWAYKPNKRSYPLICIPTTAGTSSEVAPGCVAADDETGEKYFSPTRAALALVDPALTVGCPPFVTACCGFDMLAHTIESYTNPNAEHWMSDYMDETTIEIMCQWLPVAVKDGANLEARTRVSFACLNTGYAFGDKGTHLGHAISDCIHMFNGKISHGLACAFSIPVVLRYYATRKPEKVRKIGAKAGLSLPNSYSAEKTGQYVATVFRDLIRECGIQNLDHYMQPEELEKAIQALPNNYRFEHVKEPLDFAFISGLIWQEYRS